MAERAGVFVEAMVQFSTSLRRANGFSSKNTLICNQTMLSSLRNYFSLLTTAIITMPPILSFNDSKIERIMNSHRHSSIRYEFTFGTSLLMDPGCKWLEGCPGYDNSARFSRGN